MWRPPNISHCDTTPQPPARPPSLPHTQSHTQSHAPPIRPAPARTCPSRRPLRDNASRSARRRLRPTPAVQTGALLLWAAMCLFRWSDRAKDLLHCGHWCGLMPVWLRRWRASSSDREKRHGHASPDPPTHSHSYGFSPVCRLTCALRCDDLVYLIFGCPHTFARVSSVDHMQFKAENTRQTPKEQETHVLSHPG